MPRSTRPWAVSGCSKPCALLEREIQELPRQAEIVAGQQAAAIIVDSQSGWVMADLLVRGVDDGIVMAFWAEAAKNEKALFLAAVTIGDLRRGVELIRHRGDRQQAVVLEQWLDQVMEEYGDRVLVLDGDAAQGSGRLRVPNPQHAIDKQIAASALLHGLTVVTRNTADFAGCGVDLLNSYVL